MLARTVALRRQVGPYAALLVALAVLVAGRIVLFDWWVSPDEAGFLLVAQGLGEGENLYGRYWVDRPPTLVWLFALGDLLGGIAGVRVLVGLALACFVVLLHQVARRIDASPAWTMVVAVPIVLAPAVAAQVANGESFAIPLVTASAVAVLVATRGTGRSAYTWAFLAGVLGMLAMTVKQNFADGLVFGFVLLVVSALRGERDWATTVRMLVAGLGGALAAVATMAAWALTTPAGLQGLWLSAVTFRFEADDVLRSEPGAIGERRSDLLHHALVLGFVPLLVAVLVVVLWARFRGSPAAWAVAAMLAVEVAGVVLGGNYWPHYLLGMAPGLALAAGLAGGGPAARRPHVGWLVRIVAAYLAVALLVVTVQDVRAGEGDKVARGVTVGTWVAESAEPGDTATSLYGLAYTQRATGMDSPYRHLWSLPVRVLDPDLDELTEVLRSPDAPTWLVLSFSLHAWGLDPQGQVDPVVAERYELVLHECHMLVYRLRSEPRDLAPMPHC